MHFMASGASSCAAGFLRARASRLFAAPCVHAKKASVQLRAALRRFLPATTIILLAVSSVVTLPDRARAAAPPSITAQPTASTICAGANTIFSVGASNATGFQWQVDQGAGFANISNSGQYAGATTSTLTITAATAGLNGYLYRAIVTGSASPDATSDPAALTVRSGPRITGQPSASTIPVGGNTTFSATASSATGYQWQVDQGAGFNSISNNALYSGATTATLTISGATSGMSGYMYRVIAVGACTPTAASNNAALTVVPPPTVTGVSPASGPTAGGTRVTVTGTDFTGATAVRFGASAASFTVTSPTSITATAPVNAAGTYDVTVTTPSGTSATLAADQYTYIAPATANAVSATVAANSSANMITLNITGGVPDSVAIGASPSHGTTSVSGATIAYTPTAGYSGTDSFTYTATNLSGTSVAATVSITVTRPTLELTPSPGRIPGGVAGRPYSQSFSASNGTAPNTFQITAGAPPPGISLDPATGTLSGVATATGTFNSRITATDAYGATGEANYSLTIVCQTVSFTPSRGSLLSGALTGVPYSQNISASGSGIGAFTISSSSWPPGLTFDHATNTLTGTPTQAGTYDFTVDMTDVYGCPHNATYAVEVAHPTIAMAPAAGTLPGGKTGVAYSQIISTSGGSAPYTYALTAGTLPTGVTFDAATATLSGTPTTIGNSSFTLTATDAYGASTSAAYALNVSYPTIVVSPAASALPDATTGIAYGLSLSASGGSGPYNYAITVGRLPAGLTLEPLTGVISGTPSTSESTSFTVTVTDAYSASASAAYTIAVAFPTIDLSPSAGALPGATIGAAYSQTISASGGSAPYSYVVSAGHLPAGLTLDGPTGALSGTPTTTGTSNFTVTATDAYAASTTASYSLTATFPTVVVTPAAGALPGGTTGVAYSQAISASGGSAPYSYTLAGGSLPVGLTLDRATGMLAGTPTAAGSNAFTIAATDAYGASTTASYSLTAASPVVALTPAAGALPGGTTGVAYSQAITASGGSAPYSYTLAGGSLPAGLTLDRATGMLAGTPTAAGSNTFTIAATDAYGATNGAAYSLTIVPALSAPIVHAVSVTVAAKSTGNAIPLNITGDPADSVAVASQPSHGTAKGTGTTISYTPAADYSGSDSFTYTASNAAGISTAATVTITVSAPAFTFTPAGGSLANAMAGEDYRQQITAVGGRAPMLYRIASGALPDGMVLNVSTGELTGPLGPRSEGEYAFSIRAEDGNGATGTETYRLTVTPPEITVGDKVIDVPAGATPADVYLNRGATGGPFTEAQLSFVEPASAGTATIIRGQLAQAGAVGTPVGWYLQFTPNPAFSGKAKVGYRLTSALGVSNTGTITYNLSFGAQQVAEDIDALVRGFVATRQDLIATGIFVPGLLERRQMERATDTIAARMSPSEDGMTANLSTSLAQLDAARDAADGISDAQPRAFNAWVDLAFLAHSRDENDGKWGSFAMLNVGADYLLSEKALVGLSFHYDRMTDPTDADAELTGNGWLAGPYASLELGKGVFWDTSLLYGGSANDIDTAFWDGTFDTTRWMIDTAIEGQWDLDPSTVLTPKLRAVYFSETVDDYTVHNSAGDRITIDGFDQEQFRVSLGAEIERSFLLENGSTLTPKLGATAGYSGLDGSGLFGNLTAGISLATADFWLLDLGLLLNVGEDGEKSVGGRARASRQF